MECNTKSSSQYIFVLVDVSTVSSAFHFTLIHTPSIMVINVFITGILVPYFNPTVQRWGFMIRIIIFKNLTFKTGLS